VIHDSWAKEIFGRHVNKSGEERIEKSKRGLPYVVEALRGLLDGTVN
jgi:hypothetical protein